MKTIAVLLTCHNRKNNTIACLDALFRCTLPEHHSLSIFLVDDGSTDGTPEAIASQFPSVHLLQGDGNLYWNRGMHLAWKTAASYKDFDYYLWLNDDTFLFQDAFSTLFQKKFQDAIICGATQSKQSATITYSGYLKKPKTIVKPNGSYQECDFCNGNFVLVPREVFQKNGNLDPYFHHALGDFDYSLRAKRIGFAVYVAPKSIGTCERHEELPKWRSTKVDVKTRFKNLYSSQSGCYPPEFYIYDKRHNGFFSAAFHYLSIHLRAIFPGLWKV